MRFSSVLILFTLLLFAISCGGGGSVASGGISGTGGVVASGGISGTGGLAKVSGVIEDIDMNVTQSGKSKASTISVKAVNIDDESQEYSVILSGNTYAVEVPNGVSFKLDVYADSNLLLQRTFLSTHTESTSVSANVNTVSHLMSSMLLAYAGGGNVIDNSLESVENELFGKIKLSEADMNLKALSSHSNETAFLPAIQRNLLKLNSDSALSLAFQFSQSYASTNILSVKSAWDSVATGISNTTDASTYIAAFVGAQNDEIFTSYSANLNDNSLFASIENDDAKPIISVFAETVEIVTGTLFDYTFSEATIADSRGIQSYSGSFDVTPTGVYVVDLNLGKNIQFIPSVGDAGKTFVYTLTVTASNGNQAQATITFNVSSHKLTSSATHRLANWQNGVTVPINPILLDSSIAVLSKQSEVYELESFLVSSVLIADQSNITRSANLIIHSTPRSMVNYGGDLYLSTSENVIRLREKGSSFEVIGSLSHTGADKMVVLGNVIFGFNNETKSASSFYPDLSSNGLLQGNTTFNTNSVTNSYMDLYVFQDNLLFTNRIALDFYDANFNFLNQSNLSESARWTLPVKGLGNQHIYFFGNTKNQHLSHDQTKTLISSKDYGFSSLIDSFFASLGTTHLVMQNTNTIGYYDKGRNEVFSLLQDANLSVASAEIPYVFSLNLSDEKLYDRFVIFSRNSSVESWQFSVYVLEK